MNESATLQERSGVGIANHDPVEWRCSWQIAKYDVSDLKRVDPTFLAHMSAEQQLAALVAKGLEPYEVIDREGNLLLYGGASCLWQCLIGNGTTTAGQALTYFNNAQAAIGVGDSSTGAAATQTNLQAASNKLRKAMDSTYPQHTDATTSGAASIIFRSTFGSSEANWAWQEWVVANSTTDGTGRCLNRKVESNGTKASGASWQFTVTLSLA